jgi:hypothetical protein
MKFNETGADAWQQLFVSLPGFMVAAGGTDLKKAAERMNIAGSLICDQVSGCD